MSKQIADKSADLTTVVPGTKPSVGNLLRAQRKTILVALIMVVAGFWIFGPMNRWALAACLAAGIALGLINHLVTEFWLYKVISSGVELTRNKMAASAFVRLMVLTAVAVAIAAVFWPDGAGLLFGLAIFRLIALVMTTIPLLKELKKA
jgi:hypothetical protein